MKKNRWALASIALSLGVLVATAQNRTVLEGAKPYTPSRLEWLALTMEAQDHAELSEVSDDSMDFVGMEKQNAILIYVRYLPNVRRDLMNSRIDNARKVIGTTAKSLGWNSWLKIQEDVEMESLPPK